MTTEHIHAVNMGRMTVAEAEKLEAEAAAKAKAPAKGTAPKTSAK